ncbi:DUF3857 domain-containing protein [Empedobacter falsenii]|uniref:DUF3857 domain-containing protein n=1 Tax=Empedobacter falsenii TaxID=343874 RepID=A0ABY8V6J8_9FLAO|nr:MULTISPECIES: DUF3857 domain-containing protein [Empedobacter]MDM1522927.1 DUF3857 domain-containing protein [Empedobacter sp. 225-1]MDM1542905.1 DUF3857 domain-containing protein [Empedobacter sp. 189-2]WIH97113.1 DUF3857 domain-containing protein [Empedobacter falsenii]
MKIIFTLFFLLLTIFSNAQNKEFKLGKISQQEIAFNQAPFEKDADAVILSEEGKMDLIQSNYYLTVKRRIKILTEKGVDQANIQLNYYSKNKQESITGIKGNTINISNGIEQVIPIDEKEIFDISLNELYSAKRFTFPNVKVGSIIEYTYVKGSEHNFSIDAWNFQHDIPTLSSKFRLINKAYSAYSIITIGDALNEKYKNKSSSSEWSLNNIQSYNQLKYVYNPEDQSERIKLQADNYHTDGAKKTTLNAWQDLIQDINSQYENYRNPSAIREIAQKIPNGKDEVETLRNVIEYIDANVKWNRFYGIIPSRSNRTLLKEKAGSTADMNLLLNEILTAKGFETSLVLFSSRHHGQILFSYPFVNQFNSVVTVVKLNNGTANVILDASKLNKEQIEFGPLDVFNYHGVVIKKGEPSFVKLNQKLSYYESSIKYDFLNNGNLVLYRKDKFNGYFYDENAEEKNVLNRFVTESLEMRLDEESSDKLIFETDSYVKSYKSKTKTPNAAFYTFINPLREFLKQYTFEDTNRQRKIEFNYPYLFNIQVKSKIPAGYEVVIDENYKTHHKIELNLEYYQEAKIKDGQLIIAIQFLLPEGVYEAEKYNELKQFFEKVKTASLKEILMKKN